jgi:radical SAM protein with 4Fe4S-binding SPASM domain
MNMGDCLMLRPSFSLRVARDRAYIVRVADQQPVAALTAPEAVMIGLLDARRTAASLEQTFVAAFGEYMRPAFQYAMNRLGPLLCTEPSRAGSYTLHQLASVQQPDPREGIRLLPGPRVLHWHVTQYCPRRCSYCYAEPVHGSQALDATIDGNRLSTLFREAVDLGAQTILVSGAEPFLRDDLPEVLGFAVSAGLTVLLTTKHPISISTATRLASAGVRHLSLSIDSLDPLENKWLVGSSGYGAQMLRAMRNLRSTGIEFSVQTVVTRHNLNSIEAVGRLVEREGGRVLQLVPFKDVRNPITERSNADLRLLDESIVVQMRDKLQRILPGLRVERYVEASNIGGFHCDIGQTKLLILPDGVIHRCYKLTSDSSLRGLDLKHVSLAHGWHDPGFASVVMPAENAYSGSTCSSCGSKPTCDRSGRCIYDALVHHDRYAAPDRNCDGRGTMSARRTIAIHAV